MKVTMFPRLHLQSAPAGPMAALKAMGDCGVTRESSAQGRFSAFQTTQEPKSTDS